MFQQQNSYEPGRKPKPNNNNTANRAAMVNVRKASATTTTITHANGNGSALTDTVMKMEEPTELLLNTLPAVEKPISNNQLKKLRAREYRRRQTQLQREGKKHDNHHANTTAASSSISLVKERSSKEPTRAVAIDCEMVGTGIKGSKDMLARVSIVNLYGHVLYDKFVKPMEKVTDYRTFVSGITPDLLKDGEEFFQVQKEVCTLLKDRVLVGHAVKNDLKVLYIDHPKRDIRDTSKYFKSQAYGGRGTPSLRRLTEHHIGVNIQGRSHDSVEDAQATMRLYTKFKKQWETELTAKYMRRFNKSTWSDVEVDKSGEQKPQDE